MNLVKSSKDERSLSATKARQYFNFIFYWLEGGILKPNQNLDKKFLISEMLYL